MSAALQVVPPEYERPDASEAEEHTHLECGFCGNSFPLLDGCGLYCSRNCFLASCDAEGDS